MARCPNNALPADLPMVFKWHEAHEAGITDRRLKRLTDDGMIERIDHGLYRRIDSTVGDLALIKVALVEREATLCLASALAHADLIDGIPSAIDIALKRGTRRPRISFAGYVLRAHTPPRSSRSRPTSQRRTPQFGEIWRFCCDGRQRHRDGAVPVDIDEWRFDGASPIGCAQTSPSMMDTPSSSLTPRSRNSSDQQETLPGATRPPLQHRCSSRLTCRMLRAWHLLASNAAVLPHEGATMSA